MLVGILAAGGSTLFGLTVWDHPLFFAVVAVPALAPATAPITEIIPFISSLAIAACASPQPAAVILQFAH